MKRFNHCLLSYVLLLSLLLTAIKANAQHYIPLNKLMSICADGNDTHTTTYLESEVNKYGYYGTDTYYDNFKDTIGYLRDENLLDLLGAKDIQIYYDLYFTAENKKKLYDDLNTTGYHLFSSDDGKTGYYNSLNGRFSINVTMHENTLGISVFENNKSSDFSENYAISIGKNKLEVNSFTNTSLVHITKGDRLYLRTRGIIYHGLSGGNDPCGSSSASDNSLYAKYRYCALLVAIGNTTHRNNEATMSNDNIWSPTLMDTTFIASHDGLLKFTINCWEPRFNSGAFTVDYSINKPLPALPAAAPGRILNWPLPQNELLMYDMYHRMPEECTEEVINDKTYFNSKDGIRYQLCTYNKQVVYQIISLNNSLPNK